MCALLFVPAVLQGLVIAADEFICHRRRGLPLWEIVGHPLDTVTVVAAYAFLCLCAPTPTHQLVFTGLAVFSTLFVTKDELVHAERCAPGEHWLHSLLFVLHPTAFFCGALLWIRGIGAMFFAVQLALVSLFLFYQVIYWGLSWIRARHAK
jgi:hypothetical protein